ncbi:hypothetical protein niasHT_026660 [Heterodera trifolii]|uniref:Pseudouridylate synthase 1 homolog n=1 Tax=Heterodera trifolii TaxID=157864 RepID=A0ABD2JSP9_9BILA
MLRRLLTNFMQMMAKETRKRTAAEDGLADATDASVAVKRERRPKTVKYAMLLSYQGHEYFGMQLQHDNANFPTIESHLLDAMHKRNFITDKNRKDPFTFYFQRCARTDRSVSAVRQIVSMSLPLNDVFVRDGPALLNALLPDDIRVFGVRRTTPSFHSQKTCDGRTYSYTLPTFSFAACDEVTSADYRISTERIAQIDDLLSIFSGTHNYYNYTARLEHEDQRCKRVVYTFKCDKPFIFMDPFHNHEMEFITLYVHGQSFIMHQIRKMIGVVICVLRGFMYKSDITRSFHQNRLDIPRAPGLGLLLEKVHFNRYEKKFGRSHGSLNDWGEEIEAAVLEARDRLIVQRILREECETQSMMQWLSTLPKHQYIADPEDEHGTTVSGIFTAAYNAANAIGSTNAIVGDDEEEGEGGGPTTAPIADDDGNNNDELEEDGDGDDVDGLDDGATTTTTIDERTIVDEATAELQQEQQQQEEEQAEKEEKKIAAGAAN